MLMKTEEKPGALAMMTSIGAGYRVVSIEQGVKFTYSRGLEYLVCGQRHQATGTIRSEHGVPGNYKHGVPGNYKHGGS